MLLSRMKFSNCLLTIFFYDFATVLSRDIGLKLETNEGSSFLKMGVTFASFHIKGTLPEVREKLNRSLRGNERGLASSFNT